MHPHQVELDPTSGPQIHTDYVDLRAAKTVASNLGEAFALKKAEAQIKTHFEAWLKAKKQTRSELRAGLQEAYAIYAWTAIKKSRIERIRQKCLKNGVAVRKGTDLALAIIKCYWRAVHKGSKNRYANVLREAAHRDVPPNDLARYLAKSGQGIAALHNAFIKRKNPPESRSAREREMAYLSSGFDDDPKPASTSRCGIDLSWSKNQVARFNDANDGKKLRISVKKVDDYKGKIIAVKPCR